MIIKNTTEDQIVEAIENINKEFGDNIKCTIEPDGVRGRNVRVRLAVMKSDGKGAKIGFSGRRTVHACWHVHGRFFEELIRINADAVIMAQDKRIDKNGGNWQDWNIGSIINPLYYSEACNC
jgi:hypothetical protein